jgi:hypothetical protein
MMGVDRSGTKSTQIVERTTRVSDESSLIPFPFTHIHPLHTLVRTCETAGAMNDGHHISPSVHSLNVCSTQCDSSPARRLALPGTDERCVERGRRRLGGHSDSLCISVRRRLGKDSRGTTPTSARSSTSLSLQLSGYDRCSASNSCQ